MKYFYSCHTDIGTARTVNQDSLVIKSFQQPGHSLFLAAVCDGVGGLSQGELASRKTAEMISDWFDFEIPQILKDRNVENVLRNRLRQLITDTNKEIYYEGLKRQISNGTTMSVLLVWNDCYLIGHVGDSRIYEIGRQARQLTRDHTWIAREVARGHMTKEQARHDSRQNIVLQCIGGAREIEPWMFQGNMETQTTFLICTDGFWHYLKEDECCRQLGPSNVTDETVLERSLLEMTEQMKRRGETDNITAIAVHIY